MIATNQFTELKTGEKKHTQEHVGGGSGVSSNVSGAIHQSCVSIAYAEMPKCWLCVDETTKNFGVYS